MLTAMFLVPAVEQSEIYTGIFGNLAVRGYDPVSYFVEASAKKGNEDISTWYRNAEWHFVSERNKQAFIQDPERYLPQYGGYCAWSMAHGYSAAGDPRHWDIIDGKLYLHHNAETGKEWRRHMQKLIIKANMNWQKFVLK